MLHHFSHVCLFVTLWTVTCQAPLSMGFSKQEYWSGLPCWRSSPPRYRTHISYVSCIDRQVLYHKHHLGNPSICAYHSFIDEYLFSLLLNFCLHRPIECCRISILGLWSSDLEKVCHFSFLPHRIHNYAGRSPSPIERPYMGALTNISS